MRFLGRFRFSIAAMLMLVLTAASASAFFAEVQEHCEGLASGWPTLKYDSPTLATLAVALTALALGALKGHSAGQMMLQATLAYLGYLSLIWLAEAKRRRVLLYWFQAAFALTVALPLLARRYVKRHLPHGPRRTWWRRTCEAVVFSSLNMLLVFSGTLFQLGAFLIEAEVFDLDF